MEKNYKLVPEIEGCQGCMFLTSDGKCFDNAILTILCNETSSIAVPLIEHYDQVNSPSHYTSGSIECIDAIHASMSEDAFKGFLKGNCQKYLHRYEKKENPKQDLEKAKWYLEKLISLM